MGGELHGNPAPVVTAWFWVAANPHGATEERRGLNLVLQLDPENEPASLALLVLDRERPES